MRRCLVDKRALSTSSNSKKKVKFLGNKVDPLPKIEVKETKVVSGTSKTAVISSFTDSPHKLNEEVTQSLMAGSIVASESAEDRKKIVRVCKDRPEQGK